MATLRVSHTAIDAQPCISNKFTQDMRTESTFWIQYSVTEKCSQVVYSALNVVMMFSVQYLHFIHPVRVDLRWVPSRAGTPRLIALCHHSALQSTFARTRTAKSSGCKLASKGNCQVVHVGGGLQWLNVGKMADFLPLNLLFIWNLNYGYIPHTFKFLPRKFAHELDIHPFLSALHRV